MDPYDIIPDDGITCEGNCGISILYYSDLHLVDGRAYCDGCFNELEIYPSDNFYFTLEELVDGGWNTDDWPTK